MDYTSVHLKVPKEASELVDAAIELILKVKSIAQNGVQIEELSEIVAVSLEVLSQARDYEAIKEELNGDSESSANLAALTGVKILKALDLVS